MLAGARVIGEAVLFFLFFSAGVPVYARARTCGKQKQLELFGPCVTLWSWRTLRSVAVSHLLLCFLGLCRRRLVLINFFSRYRLAFLLFSGVTVTVWECDSSRSSGEE